MERISSVNHNIIFYYISSTNQYTGHWPIGISSELACASRMCYNNDGGAATLEL